ncbi:MAG: YadA-like family protein [Prochlorococcus marinus CUG1439]|uniref:YadA-like family protein n=1 Tax=Prochlorococcus sp. MIT 1314 TaxID=3096220 RepID=UPI001B2CB041|nr:YadA-like family protein [Prochlorococcus sp. MIT 1314]MCR8539340.1 YadA-like family protein [Prochlorococcus marinus CUG1439]
MKKLLTLFVIGISLIIGSNPSKAEEYDSWAIKINETITVRENTYVDPTDPSQGGDPGYDSYFIEIYEYNSVTGAENRKLRHQQLQDSDIGTSDQWKMYQVDSENITLDSIEGKIHLKADGQNKQYIYDIKNNTISTSNYDAPTNPTSNYQKIFEIPTVLGKSDGTKSIELGGSKIVSQQSDGSVQLGADTNDIDVVADGLNIDGGAVITKNTDGSIQIGSDGNDIDITAEGLNVDGNPLITKKDNGEIHIGKNSLITKSEEETLSDGTKVQPLYAKDADGNKIPINIDGSKLLIDGVEVQTGNNAQVTTNKNNISTNKANIKNLGEGVAGSTALTAALSALPQTSKESKLSCGVGTSSYSSRYAVGFGCASKVNERVDINAGGSYVFGGSKSYGEGTLDSGVVKAGFVFKLGELNKSQKISKTEKENLESKIGSLEEKNKQLLARLERLEKVALGDLKSKDLAVYKLQ